MFSKWWLCYCQSILSLFFPYPTGDIKSQMDFVSSHWDILLLLANSDIHFPVFQSCPWDSNSRGREKDNKEKYQLSEGIISHMNFLLNFWYCVTISPRSFCMSDELISVYPREYRVRLLLCQSNCEFTKKKKEKSGRGIFYSYCSVLSNLFNERSFLVGGTCTIFLLSDLKAVLTSSKIKTKQKSTTVVLFSGRGKKDKVLQGRVCGLNSAVTALCMSRSEVMHCVRASRCPSSPYTW